MVKLSWKLGSIENLGIGRGMEDIAMLDWAPLLYNSQFEHWVYYVFNN